MKAKGKFDLVDGLGGRCEGVRPKVTGDEVDVFLNSLDRDGLRRLLDELMTEFVTLRPHLQHRLEMKRATTGELVAKARKAIKAVSSEPYNKWDDDSFLPDYSSVLECFEHLRKAEDVKSLLALADELKERGESQAECRGEASGTVLHEFRLASTDLVRYVAVKEVWSMETYGVSFESFEPRPRSAARSSRS